MNIGEVISLIKKMLRKLSLEKTALERLKEAEERDPFKVLIATILSHRTLDEITVQAAQRLFSACKSVEDLAEADVRRIEELIKPVGFYRVKARRIKEISKILMEKFRGRVPSNMDELLSLPSVGRKTANAVIAFGFGKPAVIVDTHAHRIANRLGLVKTLTPEKTEAELRRTVDERYWPDLNDLLVPFGKAICRPIRPKCSLCLLRRACQYGRSKAFPALKIRG